MRSGLAAPRGVEQSASIFVVKVENTLHFQKVLTRLFVFAHRRDQKIARNSRFAQEGRIGAHPLPLVCELMRGRG